MSSWASKKNVTQSSTRLSQSLSYTAVFSATECPITCDNETHGCGESLTTHVVQELRRKRPQDPFCDPVVFLRSVEVYEDAVHRLPCAVTLHIPHVGYHTWIELIVSHMMSLDNESRLSWPLLSGKMQVEKNKTSLASSRVGVVTGLNTRGRVSLSGNLTEFTEKG